MRKFALFITVSILAVAGSAQTKPKRASIPSVVPVKATGLEANGGSVAGRTYTNSIFGFEIAVPETWFIAGADFESIVREKGYDLSNKSDDATAVRSKREIDVLMTAFRAEPNADDSAIIRVTAEDLAPHRQIVDAVDYFDAITAAYMNAKLPPDFTYSATKAEQLGKHQFAYLDISSNAGKKRMYATVLKGVAIMFTLSYLDDADLQTLRMVLEAGKFGK